MIEVNIDMILTKLISLLLLVQVTAFEITPYEPLPIGASSYGAVWLEPGETVYASQVINRPGGGCVDCFETWFYVHRGNYQAGWLMFEYDEEMKPKMSVVKLKGKERKVIVK